MLNKTEILNVLRMKHGLRATYLMWRSGIDPKYTVARETYAQHRRELKEHWQIDITEPYQSRGDKLAANSTIEKTGI